MADVGVCERAKQAHGLRAQRSGGAAAVDDNRRRAIANHLGRTSRNLGDRKIDRARNVHRRKRFGRQYVHEYDAAGSQRADELVTSYRGKTVQRGGRRGHQSIIARRMDCPIAAHYVFQAEARAPGRLRAVARFDFAHPFQRPGRGGIFQFNLSSGFQTLDRRFFISRNACGSKPAAIRFREDVRRQLVVAVPEKGRVASIAGGGKTIPNRDGPPAGATDRADHFAAVTVPVLARQYKRRRVLTPGRRAMYPFIRLYG